MEQKKCKECKWYRGSMCVRWPPVIIRTEDSVGSQLESLYPEVTEYTLSCGEFQKSPYEG